MEKKRLFIICLSTSLLTFTAIALSQPMFGNDASSLRCGYGLVTVGDDERHVIDKCGIPQRETYVRPAKILIYYFGPSRFKNYVSIIDGRVYRIQSGPCDGEDSDCQ